MKIGIFDPYLDSLSGGEKYMLSIAACLASYHEVFIFWDPQREAEIKQRAYKKLGIDISKIRFTPNIFSSDVSLASRFWSSKKYDLIIYLSDGSIPLVWSKLYIHFQFPVVWVNGNSIKTKIKLKRVGKIFCNSFFTKNYIDKEFNVKSLVLYPPIIIKEKRENKQDLILHVGRFGMEKEGGNYKKQDVLIEVFKKMVDSGLGGWQFTLIIGVRKEDKDNLEKLKEIAKGYPINIVENPENQFLWEQYSKAKIYWHASGFGENLDKHPEKAEHFGIATVEAMGAGVVPVVINAGGQKEIVGDGKNGFLWNKTSELIEKTNVLVQNKKLWEKMSNEAITRSKVFSGDRFCRELKALVLP